MDSITILFLCLIALCVLCGVGIEKRKYIIPFSNTAVTLGVLGTFVGIFVGLKNFNVEQISESIPVLLGGLKTAFLTSIAGMVAALILRIINTHVVKSGDDTQQEDPIQLQRMLLKEQKNVSEVLLSIQKSMCGDDTENSLLNQMKLMRTSLTDEIKTLNSSFKEFTQRQANDNTEAIMRALENVIAEFKIAIEDKLSESFKEFSVACKHLYDWQNEHKEEIEAVHAALNSAIDTLHETDLSLDRIAKSQTLFIGTIQKIDIQLKALGEHVKSIESLRERWPDLLHNLQNDIQRMITQVSVTSQNLANGLNSASKEIISSTQDIAEGMSSRVEQVLTEIDQSLKSEYEGLLESLFRPLAAISAQIANEHMKFTSGDVTSIMLPKNER